MALPETIEARERLRVERVDRAGVVLVAAESVAKSMFTDGQMEKVEGPEGELRGVYRECVERVRAELLSD